MTWYAALLDGETENEGGTDAGLVGNVLGIGPGLEARDKKKRNRALKEFQRQKRNEDLFNYGNAQRSWESTQDMIPDMVGSLDSDYLSGDMLVKTDRDQIGGAALESLSNAAHGYNPTMGFDPMLGVLDADRTAVSGLRDYAQGQTESTLGGWEDAMSKLASQYDSAGDALGARRDEMVDLYRSNIDDNRAASDQDMYKLVVESWIDSNDARGAGAMVNKSGVGNHRVKGANEGKKRELVNSLLSDGYSYSEVIDTLRHMMEKDQNAAPLIARLEGE